MTRQRAHQDVPYSKVKEIIEGTEPVRTAALLAIMYATGCRVGELTRRYKHQYGIFKRSRAGKWKKIGAEKPTYTEGIRREDIEVTKSRVYIKLPNFKNKKARFKRIGINRKKEGWLANIILNYTSLLRGQEYLFNFGWRRAIVLLNKAWPYTTHSLRHSRTNHLLNLFRWTDSAVQKYIGHARLETLKHYSRPDMELMLDRMDQIETPEIIK